jgi:hypothetical protein
VVVTLAHRWQASVVNPTGQTASFTPRRDRMKLVTNVIRSLPLNIQALVSAQLSSNPDWWKFPIRRVQAGGYTITIQPYHQPVGLDV